MMKLFKRAAVLSLCVLALSGCTQSSITADSVVVQSEMVAPDGSALVDEDVIVDRTMKVTKETDPFVFEWEQIADDTEDMFMDEDFYPLGVEMTYEEDLDAKTIKLAWVLKNETTEEEALEYATEMVQQFNNIMAIQKDCYELAEYDTFGGIWEAFALTVQVTKEDGTVMVDKSYAAGEAIDLPLPDYSDEGPNGPNGPQAETEAPISPADKLNNK